MEREGLIDEMQDRLIINLDEDDDNNDDDDDLSSAESSSDDGSYISGVEAILDRETSPDLENDTEFPVHSDFVYTSL